MLSSERPRGRLFSVGSDWIYRREYRPVEEELDTIAAARRRRRGGRAGQVSAGAEHDDHRRSGIADSRAVARASVHVRLQKFQVVGHFCRGKAFCEDDQAADRFAHGPQSFWDEHNPSVVDAAAVQP